MQRTICVTLCALGVFASAIALPPTTARGDDLHGLGAIGTGIAHAEPTSYPGLLQSERGLNFGGPTVPYAFGATGATTNSMLYPGSQVDKLVAEANAGNITLALFGIGSNDYLNAGDEIIAGTLSGAALDAYHAQVVANFAMATSAVESAGAKSIIGGVGNLIYLPAVQEAALNPAELATFENAVAEGEAQVQAFALSHGIAYIDFYELLTDVYEAGSVQIGGVELILDGYSETDPHYFWEDHFHVGLVVRGAVANFYLQAINELCGTDIPLLTDLELLTLAGLENEYVGETFAAAHDYGDLVDIPEPSTLALAAMGLAAVVTVAARGRSRRRS